MPRRYRPVRRPVVPDARYNNTYVSMFINRMMIGGKKSTASAVMYKALSMAEERSKRDREQQKDFRCGRNDPSDCVHCRDPQPAAGKIGLCQFSLLIQINPPRPAFFEGRGLRWSPISSRKCRLP